MLTGPAATRPRGPGTDRRQCLPPSRLLTILAMVEPTVPPTPTVTLLPPTPTPIDVVGLPGVGLGLAVAWTVVLGLAAALAVVVVGDGLAATGVCCGAVCCAGGAPE